MFDWLITLIFTFTLTLTLTIFGNFILEKSAGSKSGAHVDFYLLSYYPQLFDWLITLTLTILDNLILEKGAGSKSGVYVDFYGCTSILMTNSA